MKPFFVPLFVLTSASFSFAGDMSLPPPDKDGGMPLMQALTARATNRSFQSTPLTPQTLSDLLYAAWGVNRADSGKRTVPTAMNMQNLSVYAAFPDGLYKYDASANKLVFVMSGDLRGKTFMRPAMPLSAPVVLIYTADLSKGRDKESAMIYSAAHAGSAYQNVYLCCASKNLATVICGGFDKKALSEAMKLPENEVVLFTQPVGNK